MKSKPVLKDSYAEKGVNDFLEEVSIWKENLNSRMQANVLLKNGLSDILKHNYQHYLLEEIEEFQTDFINQDEITNLLRKAVDHLYSLSLNKSFEEQKSRKLLAKSANHLRDNIQYSGNRFRILSLKFEDFQDKIGILPKN